MGRNSAAEALKTREAIIARAIDVASVEGLEGVTIGRLASDLGMSKAGVIGQFGSKAELQVAALDAASQIFADRVWAPAADEDPGLPRLLAVCDAWVDHIARSPFAGGCFWTAASAEFDGRGGPVHEAVQARMRRWRKILRTEILTAIEAGQLPADLDPDQAVFELEAIPMGLNQSLQLFGDKVAPAMARKAMRRVLGPDAPLPARARATVNRG
jgi:AcrR family transcriptional regulator